MKISQFEVYHHQTPFGQLIVNSTQANRAITEPVLGETSYRKLICDSKYTITFGVDISPKPTYRNSQFAKGLHLGHHLGLPGQVSISKNALNIVLTNGFLNDYTKVFWNYALKFYLSAMALQNSALHLKATTLSDSDGNALLIIGKGGSGKSTLAEKLNQFGYNTVSNTHTLYKDGYVWGLNTWIRKRFNDSQHYLPPTPLKTERLAKLKKIIIFERNKNDVHHEETLSIEKSMNFVIQFGLATCNYDLKEDLSDLFSSDFEYLNHSQHEYHLLKNMLTSVPITYLTGNIHNNSSLDKILSSMRG